MPQDWSRSLSRLHSFTTSNRKKSQRLEIPDFTNDNVVVNSPIEVFKPFDNLPLELQLEIFTHCLPPFASFDPNEAPLLIARVSKTWRTIVLSTPRLWSTFEVEITGTPGPTVSSYDLHIMSTMKLWLQRSKNYPLSVRVSHIPSSRIHDSRSAELVALLIPEIRRWKHVELLIPASSIQPLQTALPNGFPALQSLTLQMKGFWTTEPALDLELLNIPWHQLTTLDLQLGANHLLTLDHYLHILSQTENLRHCTVSAQCTFSSDGLEREESAIIRLANLESLQLILQEPVESSHGVSPERALVRFLKSISITNLQTLKLGWLVTSPEGVWQTVHTDFLSVLQHVASSLRTLSISYLPVKESQLLEYFAILSEVSNLELRFSLSSRDYDPITDRLFSALSIYPEVRTPSPSNDLRETAGSPHTERTDRSLLPQLDTLHIESSGREYSHSALVSMIQSRWNAARYQTESVRSQTPQFRFLSMSPVLSALEKRIKLWNDEGLDVTIDSVSLR